MQCHQCQAVNREERRFCAECGVNLNRACSSCGFSNEPGEKFCGGCGSQIAGIMPAPESLFRSPTLYTPKHLVEKILQSKSALEGERKQVTALFCDIANSTVLANRLGPEAMHMANDPTTDEWMKWRYTTHLFSSYGRFWLQRGELNRAKRLADRCLENATRTNSRKYLVKGWRLKAEIAAMGKKRDEAESGFQQALHMAKAISNPTQLWKTYFSTGRFYETSGRREPAQECYGAARDIIDQIKSGLQTPELRSSLENSIFIRKVYENS